MTRDFADFPNVMARELSAAVAGFELQSEQLFEPITEIVRPRGVRLAGAMKVRHFACWVWAEIIHSQMLLCKAPEHSNFPDHGICNCGPVL